MFSFRVKISKLWEFAWLGKAEVGMDGGEDKINAEALGWGTQEERESKAHSNQRSKARGYVQARGGLGSESETLSLRWRLRTSLHKMR